MLIACANLANLLLARGAAQRVRTAVELALGASRGQIRFARRSPTSIRIWPPLSITSLPELVRVEISAQTLVARLSDAFGAMALPSL